MSSWGDALKSTSERIREAVEALKEVAPDYWAATLAQRAELSGKAAGSVYEGVNAGQLEDMILRAQWEPYEHPEVMAGCSAFRARVAGRMGIIRLDTLAPETFVTLDDPKQTGQVYAVVDGSRGPVVDFSVLILGTEQEREVVFTFHPGDPAKPSQVPAAGQHGTQVTVAQALAMGLVTAKVK